MYCLFKKTENKQKRDRGWPIFITLIYEAELNKSYTWAVVVAQLVERFLPTPEGSGSNPVISNFY